MTTFTSNNEAKKVAEQIAKTTQVFFTNEVLEILFTSGDKNQKEIANELKSVFTDVKVKGRKVQSIVINRIKQVTMDLELQKLNTKLEKIETELSKCRGSVLEDGWQTQRHAKKSRKWDYYAQEKNKIREQIDQIEQRGQEK